MHCCEEFRPPKEALIALGVPADEAETLQVKRSAGCQRCAETGYRGRIALYEIMPVREELRELILKGATALEIKQTAVRLGMTTLRKSGVARLREGVTTLEEILRVTKAD
jgi:type IV pilus assembly protein PilB